MSRFIAPLALIIAVLSLALNVILLTRLDRARNGALDVLDHTSRRLDGLSDVSFQQTIHVNQALSVKGELPFQQEFTVPINTSVPIDTTAHVNTATPFGNVDVPVTINTTVPVNLQVPITISRTVPYSFSVPIDLDVPIQVRLRDLGVDASIKEAQDEIQQLRGALQ